MSSKKQYRIKKSITDADFESIYIISDSCISALRQSTFPAQKPRPGGEHAPWNGRTCDLKGATVPLANGFCVPADWIESVPVRKKKKPASGEATLADELRDAIKHRLLAWQNVPYAKLLKAARLLGVDTSKF